MYGNYYNPYQIQPQSQYMTPRNEMPQYMSQRMELTRVNGRAGAEAYAMPPNSVVA